MAGRGNSLTTFLLAKIDKVSPMEWTSFFRMSPSLDGYRFGVIRRCTIGHCMRVNETLNRALGAVDKDVRVRSLGKLTQGKA